MKRDNLSITWRRRGKKKRSHDSRSIKNHHLKTLPISPFSNRHHWPKCTVIETFIKKLQLQFFWQTKLIFFSHKTGSFFGVIFVALMDARKDRRKTTEIISLPRQRYLICINDFQKKWCSSLLKNLILSILPSLLVSTRLPGVPDKNPLIFMSLNISLFTHRNFLQIIAFSHSLQMFLFMAYSTRAI